MLQKLTRPIVRGRIHKRSQYVSQTPRLKFDDGCGGVGERLLSFVVDSGSVQSSDAPDSENYLNYKTLCTEGFSAVPKTDPLSLAINFSIGPATATDAATISDSYPFALLSRQTLCKFNANIHCSSGWLKLENPSVHNSMLRAVISHSPQPSDQVRFATLGHAPNQLPVLISTAPCPVANGPFL
ncbi:hypothetical protein chiPu_0020816 [Chiloscyllium punctatum]|uniref:Uncharacterized protein n=1 Tax=Chiloscyllium punctatum TaxID=137246 RepID=A0A401RK11_CHIPU|nr:hypothetical protein [Chiloscyllium punctatum]